VRFVPGGPFTAEKAVTPEILRNLEAHYGLDKPLWRQYLDYLGSLARGDLGPSFKYPNRTVNEIIFDKVPVSAELGSISLAVALVLGIGLGTLAAIRRNTWVDYVASSFGMIGISIPTFVVGPLLVLALAIHLGWFNASGWYGPADRVLPALVLGIAYAAPISRLTRGGLLEVLNQDFIRTARAKGASEFRVVTRHALRGGLLPVQQWYVRRDDGPDLRIMHGLVRGCDHRRQPRAEACNQRGRVGGRVVGRRRRGGVAAAIALLAAMRHCRVRQAQRAVQRRLELLLAPR
jgi:oligopeptide transport system permease protein